MDLAALFPEPAALRHRPRALRLVNADEQRLIAECLRGRSAAYGELIRPYQDRLFNTVYRLVGNAEDAQDVVQEAFIHAYQSLGQFKGDARFYTWIYRIAINAAISHRRRRRVVLSIHRSPTGREDHEPPDRSEYNRPGHALEQAEQERRVQEALDRLSPEHRAVLVLRDMEGEPYETIAQIVGVPIGTVRSRLHRARFELREIWQREEP